MPGSTGSRPPDDETIKRLSKAVSLRAAGATWQVVADQSGYSDRSNARKAVIKHLAEDLHDNVENLRALEGARLDTLQRSIWARALSGDLDAHDRVLRIMGARARLFGLNAPTKVEITDEMDREIQMLAASLVEDDTWNITGVPDVEEIEG